MRILGLDYGSRTVGVAVCDELETVSRPLETIFRKRENKLRQTLARIDEIIAEYGAGKIVLGFPLHMNSEEGERCEKTRLFKSELERRTHLKVVLVDERLTTVASDSILKEAGVDKKDRKSVIDSIAAAIILQSYLDEGCGITD